MIRAASLTALLDFRFIPYPYYADSATKSKPFTLFLLDTNSVVWDTNSREKHMAPQQMKLFETPVMIAQCVYCHQTKGKVLRERETLDLRYPGRQDSDAAICCTPDSEWRCPRCSSQDLQFGMYYPIAEGDECREMAACACGWRGEADECAPPDQPWDELTMVAEEFHIDAFRRGPGRETRTALEVVA